MKESTYEIKRLSNFLKINGIVIKHNNMKKATVTFEVIEDTTTVTATGLTGNADVINITGTDIEKQFISLLKKLHEHQLANEIMQAVDINNWEEVKQKL